MPEGPMKDKTKHFLERFTKDKLKAIVVSKDVSGVFLRRLILLS
jgi:hypothetical protein